MTFAELRAKDAKLRAIAPEIDKLLLNLVQGDPMAVSASVLSQLVASLEALKCGYLLLAEAGNFYGANVILRVFLEHLLKATAIFLDFAAQKNSLAEGYLRLAECEARAYLKALEYAGIHEDLISESPLFSLLTKGRSLSRKEAEMLESPFKYKALIEKIRSDLGSDAGSFLLKIVPNYSELSGFVHGGPSAALITSRSPDELKQKLFLDAELVVGCLYSVKRYLLILASSLRPEFEDDLERLSAAIEDFSS